MANQIPLDSSEFDERSDHLAASTTSLHQDGVDYAFLYVKGGALDSTQFSPKLGGCTPADLGSYDWGLVLPCGPLPWAQGPVHHAGNSVASTDIGFRQQSQNDNNTTTWPQLQQSVLQEASLNALEQSFPPIGLDSTQPVATIQSAYPELTPSLSLPEPIVQPDAEVKELPDGRFYCSALGCFAIYLRAGDCRRHLKKHNGPFFPCTQPGCDMEFYRADKLRSHLKQGHNIIVVAPRRGRRTANPSTCRPTGIVRPGGY